MKPIMLCIFAHPDDEAFGPAGTIALYAKTHDVYIVCVTNGDDQTNTEVKKGSLPALRNAELRESAAVLGVKEVLFLDYRDGDLNNNQYHAVADKLTAIAAKLHPETMMTFEPRGVSGHLDHIAVSMISSYVFEHTESVRELLYYCIDDAHRREFDSYFIYFPPGYPPEQIDRTIDVGPVWQQKIEAIHKHHTQQKDIDRIVPILDKLSKNEYFLVKKRGI